MSNVRGRIAVDVQFADSTTSAGVQSLKTITLQDATEYTTGKVAVVTGTCGTAQVSIIPNPSTYENAAGNTVAITQQSRIAFAASGSRPVFLQTSNSVVLMSANGRAAVSDSIDGDEDSFFVNVIGTAAGTASYTLVIYGS